MSIEATRAAGSRSPASVWQYSGHDAILVMLSVLQGITLALLPFVVDGRISAVAATVVLALGLWWGSNTVAHNFIHRPFFSLAAMNRLYSLYLSIVLGVPQSLWKGMHLAHHARRRHVLRLRPDLLLESLAVLALWAGLLLVVPAFFLGVYVPAYAAGIAIGFAHGYFEHVPATTSYYGRLYNFLLFNDGYHVEHHAQPRCHWTGVPGVRLRGRVSRYPPLMRWVEWVTLENLERAALRWPWLQDWMLRCHERALAALADRIGPVERITIVGGGLFPRSAILLRGLYPRADIRVVDASARNLAIAKNYCEARGLKLNVDFVPGIFEATQAQPDVDLLVTPLSFIGERSQLYARPPVPKILVHDWLWHTGAWRSAVVSVFLLKRINLVSAV